MVGRKEKIAKESGCLVMNDNSISLTDLPRRLREISGGSIAVPTYRVLYGRILDGAIPAQRINGRWHVSESVARDIVKALASSEE
jgi:hypothetical protein